MFDVPILLILWKRPASTRRLIDSLRPLRPSCLYVACDGPDPTSPTVADMVNRTREVVDVAIDWSPSIQRFYSPVNQGCRDAVSRAITWFFECVQEGIILEDDCIPHPDFFPYCASLLERYRNDHRVFSICGSNFQRGKVRGTASYYFSIHADSWGWATWRRAWSAYPLAEVNWFSFRDSHQLENVFPIAVERQYWRYILDQLFIHHYPSAWDYQWMLAGWMNNALHAWPNVNLIANIGHDGDGTHTFGLNAFSSTPIHALQTIEHPVAFVPDRQADAYAFWRRRSGIRFAVQLTLGPLYSILSGPLRLLLYAYRFMGGRF